MKACDWHKPHGLGYLSFFQWANDQTSKGYVQTQCEICRHWFFPKQFGKPKKAQNCEGDTCEK